MEQCKASREPVEVALALIFAFKRITINNFMSEHIAGTNYRACLRYKTC